MADRSLNPQPHNGSVRWAAAQTGSCQSRCPARAPTATCRRSAAGAPSRQLPPPLRSFPLALPARAGAWDPFRPASLVLLCMRALRPSVSSSKHLCLPRHHLWGTCWASTPPQCQLGLPQQLGCSQQPQGSAVNPACKPKRTHRLLSLSASPLHHQQHISRACGRSGQVCRVQCRCRRLEQRTISGTVPR